LLYKISILKYNTAVILPVLYGCESSSVALREEHRLRVYENSGMRKIFEPTRVEGSNLFAQ
jgi:hypothetical protein